MYFRLQSCAACCPVLSWHGLVWSSCPGWVLQVFLMFLVGVCVCLVFGRAMMARLERLVLGRVSEQCRGRACVVLWKRRCFLFDCEWWVGAAVSGQAVCGGVLSCCQCGFDSPVVPFAAEGRWVSLPFSGGLCYRCCWHFNAFGARRVGSLAAAVGCCWLLGTGCWAGLGWRDCSAGTKTEAQFRRETIVYHNNY